MRLILNLLISGFAVFLTARLLPGVEVTNFGTAVLVAGLLAVVSVLLGPVLLALTLPINAVTLGLFTFVIIGMLVMVVDALVGGFHVLSFWHDLAFGVVLAVINGVLIAPLPHRWARNGPKLP